MGCYDKDEEPKVFSVRTVRGEPYRIGGRTLIPVTRIISFGKASATIRSRRFGGWGGGFVWATPVALLEETEDGEQTIAIHDATLAAVQRLILAALAVALFFGAVRQWVGRRRKTHTV